jgi:FMN phosphatase YigB (HAD superfamily)
VLGAVLFDVGGTLLRGRPEVSPRELSLAQLVARFGERDWYGSLLDADLLTEMLADDPAEPMRQRTLETVGRWLESQQVPSRHLVDLDELRRTIVVPGSISGQLAPGAREALEWCRANRVRTVLVSNTLWSASEDFLSDFGALGLEGLVDGAVTSHTVGFRKPHRAIFEAALAIAGVNARDAVMVGDEPYQDVLGAQRLGMRAVWLRPSGPRAIPVGEPDGFAVTPDAQIESLAELPEVLERWLR